MTDQNAGGSHIRGVIKSKSDLILLIMIDQNSCGLHIVIIFCYNLTKFVITVAQFNIK